MCIKNSWDKGLTCTNVMICCQCDLATVTHSQDQLNWEMNAWPGSKHKHHFECHRILYKAKYVVESEKRGNFAHGQKELFLFQIVHNFQAVVVASLQTWCSDSPIIHCCTHAGKFVPRPLPVWAWYSRLSHAVENRPLYLSLWSSTISGKNIGFLTVDFFSQTNSWGANKARIKPMALSIFEWWQHSVKI